MVGWLIAGIIVRRIFVRGLGGVVGEGINVTKLKIKFCGKHWKIRRKNEHIFPPEAIISLNANA